MPYVKYDFSIRPPLEKEVYLLLKDLEKKHNLNRRDMVTACIKITNYFINKELSPESEQVVKNFLKA